ncbi:hypothetical protein ALC56_09127 [Trachymyrmex septentrionalis]|uniref:Uncharacterized protein n=1 Tax=Trachymyrmex septentrionalis TaxID=34720 RepID=A0A151JV87_9HYME|nr:hypothetical protein ALC56_09127 [Trachymyrmex septentrionalis]
MYYECRRHYNTILNVKAAAGSREEYCVAHNDVDILRRLCMVFRKIFLEHDNICPFEECTIISLCMKVFRKKLLARRRNRNHSFGRIQKCG